MTRPTVFVDPGVGYSRSSGTGIVATDGTGRPLTWCVMRQRHHDGDGDGGPEWEAVRRSSGKVIYVEPVDAFIDRLVTTVRHVCNLVSPSGPLPLLGVEGVTAPGGFSRGGRKGIIDPAPLLHIAGAVHVLRYVLDAVVIPPGRLGKVHEEHPAVKPEHVYPTVLCGRRDRPLGDMDDGGGNDHLWSAYEGVAALRRHLRTR